MSRWFRRLQSHLSNADGPNTANITHAEARQNVLIAELQRRSRNLLTVVQSIARRTVGKGSTLDALSARLAALGRVQSLVSSGPTDTIDLGDLVGLELEAIGATDGGKVRVTGPSVSLNFELIQTLGLALHELTTNALKYGALKHRAGSLTISGDVRHNPDTSSPTLTLDWMETGVPIFKAPPGKGFGRELIQRALISSLNAKSKMTFGPDGLSCHIEVPLRSRIGASPIGLASRLLTWRPYSNGTAFLDVSISVPVHDRRTDWKRMVQIDVLEKPIERIRETCGMIGIAQEFDRALPDLETFLEAQVARGETRETWLTFDGLLNLKRLLAKG